MIAGTTPATVYHSGLGSPTAGFGQQVHAEWTKLRTVRSWLATTVVAAIVLVLFSWFVANGNHASMCDGPNSCHGLPPLPVGPGGEAVSDSYYFVHRSLTGDGSITVRATSLTGRVSARGNVSSAGSDPLAGSRPGLSPWAKAGLLVTSSLKQGAAYAAVVVTGAHGVRMQDDYTHDVGGSPGAVSSQAPRWLRLTRHGETLVGAESADGVRWTTIDSVHLSRLPSTVQVGLMVASPTIPTAGGGFQSTYATAQFDHLGLSTSSGAPGAAGTTGWVGADVGSGPSYPTLAAGSYHQAGGQLTVSGSGDIAPAVDGAGGGASTGNTGLIGAFAAMIAVAVLGALFITAEFRRGLFRTTLTASPRRGRLLVAKSVVVGGATFVPALIGAVVAVLVSRRVLVSNGNALFPISAVTEVRVVVGTAAVVALTSILAMAVGAILRRSAGAVAFVVVAVVVPFIIALTPSMSSGIGAWLLRVSPAAGFAVQQELVRYGQVTNAYTPVNGYFPLPPWAGFAVLCAWTLLALGLANRLIARRDA